MAVTNPTPPRFVLCELPDDLEKTVNAFEDDFNDALKPYFDQLNFLALTEIPGIAAALETQIALRKDLIAGAIAPGLTSLEDIENSLKLTNPDRQGDDPDTVRIDERKLGAYGICILNGRVFKMLGGTRLDGFRLLWEVAGGDIERFNLLANNIFALQGGGFALYEYNPETKNFPYVNRGFEQSESLSGYKRSVFRHRLFWNNSIGPTTANRLKLEALGFTATQVTDILAGEDPNASENPGALFSESVDLVRQLGRLLILPTTSPLRQPRWQGESDLIEFSIERYLDYRLARNTTSSVLDQSYYNLLVANLRPQDLKELFEQRPEVHDIELPQDLDSITTLVSKAIGKPKGTNINTYMNQLPVGETYDDTYACGLYDLGLSLWRIFSTQLPSRANTLTPLLQELIQKNVAITPITPFCQGPQALSPAQIAAALGSTSLPPEGLAADLLYGVLLTGNPPYVGGDPPFNGVPTENLPILLTVSTITSGSLAESQGGDSTGTQQGRPTEETAGMLLARTIRWSENFTESCGTFTTVTDTSAVAAGATVVTQTTTVKSVDKMGVTVQGSNVLVIVGDTSEIEVGMLVTPAQNTLQAETRVQAIDTLNNTVTLSLPATKATVRGEFTFSTTTTASTSAAAGRRDIQQSEGRPRTINASSNITLCPPGGTIGKLGREFEKIRKDLELWLQRIVETIRRVLVNLQEKVDAFILQFQILLDGILSKLEKLVSLDVNLSAKGNFENSILKCTFGFDMKFKINLLNLLLGFLDQMFPTIGLPIRKFLDLIRDFLSEIFCIPIRFVESLLGAADAALAELSSLSGGLVVCSVKDFKLPDVILEVLNLVNGTFSLRSLVLRQASADWIQLTLRLKNERDEFTGLSQFASACNRPSLGDALDQLANIASVNSSDIPLRSQNRVAAAVREQVVSSMIA